MMSCRKRPGAPGIPFATAHHNYACVYRAGVPNPVQTAFRGPTPHLRRRGAFFRARLVLTSSISLGVLDEHARDVRVADHNNATHADMRVRIRHALFPMGCCALDSVEIRFGDAT